MNRFVQLHLLTFYPPSNLNRDDTGKPKTAIIGGATRLRVSSQALKRAWRTSDLFAKVVGEAFGIEAPNFEQAKGIVLGIRSKRVISMIIAEVAKLKGSLDIDREAVAEKVKAALAKAKNKNDESDDDESESDEEANTKKGSKGKKVGKLVIGSIDPKKPLETKEAVHLGPEEVENAKHIAKMIANGETLDPKKVSLLLERPKAVDIGMFGRMLADSPAYNVEAAVQVAHAVTTHKVVVDDDYFTAVDDLKKKGEDDAGAGFLSETGFGAGVFYLYINIDRALLAKNLGGDAGVAKKAVEALIRAAATIGPRGKSASFASFARASYILAESGDAAPRTLAGAFLKSVDQGVEQKDREKGFLELSIAALEMTRNNFAAVYGDEGVASARMNALAGEGSLDEIVAFACEGL